jgi:putative endonuclease
MKNMAEHNDTGKKGEDIAVEYLKKEGYRILERNWHNSHQEIDVIASKGGELVIVEVKCRTGTPPVESSSAVNRTKQNLLIRAANAYICQKNLDMETRFDIIAVSLNREVKVEHITNAFYPQMRRNC